MFGADDIDSGMTFSDSVRFKPFIVAESPLLVAYPADIHEFWNNNLRLILLRKIGGGYE